MLEAGGPSCTWSVATVFSGTTDSKLGAFDQNFETIRNSANNTVMSPARSQQDMYGNCSVL